MCEPLRPRPPGATIRIGPKSGPCAPRVSPPCPPHYRRPPWRPRPAPRSAGAKPTALSTRSRRPREARRRSRTRRRLVPELKRRRRSGAEGLEESGEQLRMGTGSRASSRARRRCARSRARPEQSLESRDVAPDDREIARRRSVLLAQHSAADRSRQRVLDGVGDVGGEGLHEAAARFERHESSSSARARSPISSRRAERRSGAARRAVTHLHPAPPVSRREGFAGIVVAELEAGTRSNSFVGEVEEQIGSSSGAAQPPSHSRPSCSVIQCRGRGSGSSRRKAPRPRAVASGHRVTSLALDSSRASRCPLVVDDGEAPSLSAGRGEPVRTSMGLGEPVAHEDGTRPARGRDALHREGHAVARVEGLPVALEHVLGAAREGQPERVAPEAR